jgi:mRNA interferase MazF
MRIERYGVYWVNLDPVVGQEIAESRPAVVVSDEAMNEHLGTVVLCPITSRLHPRWPSRIQATIGGRRAEIAVDQVRTVARERLGKRVGRLPAEIAVEVRHLITLMYGVHSVSMEDPK